jgi:hypothetical protein
MNFLRARRCDEVQGYYFSRPLSVADVEHWQQSDQSGIAPSSASAPDAYALKQPA